MKGRRPTKRQKEVIARWHLNPANWLVCKAPTGELHIKNRNTKRERILLI